MAQVECDPGVRCYPVDRGAAFGIRGSVESGRHDWGSLARLSSPQWGMPARLNSEYAGLMRFRTWPVAALGLGGLLLLVVVSVLAASNRAQEIYTQLDQLNTHHRDVENKLRLPAIGCVTLRHLHARLPARSRARARAPTTAISSPSTGRATSTTVAELRALWLGQTGHDERLASLDAKLDEYWQAFEPLFDWTPAEKMLLSSGFLKHEVLPRREAVLTIASRSKR